MVTCCLPPAADWWPVPRRERIAWLVHGFAVATETSGSPTDPTPHLATDAAAKPDKRRDDEEEQPSEGVRNPTKTGTNIEGTLKEH